MHCTASMHCTDAELHCPIGVRNAPRGNAVQSPELRGYMRLRIIPIDCSIIYYSDRYSVFSQNVVFRISFDLEISGFLILFIPLQVFINLLALNIFKTFECSNVFAFRSFGNICLRLAIRKAYFRLMKVMIEQSSFRCA